MAPDRGNSEFRAFLSEISTPSPRSDHIDPVPPESGPHCPVCHDLAYRFSIARLNAIGGYPVEVRKAAMQVMDISPGEPELREMPEGGTSVYFKNESWTPPHPHASEWIRSALRGCPSCQLVIGAASAILPAWFAEYDPDDAELGLEKKHIFTLAVDDVPLIICLTDMRQRWLYLRHDYFQVFTKEGQPRCWPTIAPAEPVCRTNNEPAAIKKIKSWIRRCHDQHQCGPQNPGFLPTRLITVEGDGPLPRCRLVDSSEIQATDNVYPPYVALSYCWGPSPERNLRTVLDNIDIHEKEIPLQYVPEAVKDAILLTRDLGYEYLWVDAICIIQDDDQDWVTESSTLGSIYKMADLVISNDTSADCQKPIFTSEIFGSPMCQTTFTPHHLQPSKEPSQYIPEFLQKPPPEDEQTDSAHVRRSPYEAHPALPQDKLSPLNSRAWTLQESLMARRRLILTPLEMFWQCLGEYRCECIHDPSLMLGPAGGRAQLLMFDAMRDMIFPDGSLSTPMNLARLHWLWKVMVIQYSPRNLTDWRDRLVAIGGLADAMLAALGRGSASQPPDSPAVLDGELYVAGLWRSDIIGGLMWAARTASELIDPDEYSYHLPEEVTTENMQQGNPFKEFVALQQKRSVNQAFRKVRAKLPLTSGKPFQTLPIDRRFRRLNGTSVRAFSSWSWASTPYPVEWTLNPRDITAEFPFLPDVTIKEVHCNTAPSDPKKRVISGHITLRGRLVPVRLRSHAALWTSQDPPDFASVKMQDARSQGIFEFFEAVYRSKTFVLFQGDQVTGLAPDSACLYGDVRQTYQGWGSYLFTEFLIFHENSTVFAVVIRLMAASIFRQLTSFASLLGRWIFRTPKTKPKVPALNMAPCWPRPEETPLGTWRLCRNRGCNCHRGWTEPRTDPFYALSMGSYKMEDFRGRSKLRLVFLVLRPSPFTKDAFVRVGIGSVERFGDEAGYHDFFKGAEPTVIRLE